MAYVSIVVDVPDGENTTGLGKTGLLRNTTNALLEDGGDLSRCGLVSIAASLSDGGLLCRCDGAGLRDEKVISWLFRHHVA